MENQEFQELFKEVQKAWGRAKGELTDEQRKAIKELFTVGQRGDRSKIKPKKAKE